MAVLSSPGLGSGLDVKGLVSQLVSVENQPVVAMQKKEASYLAKISAYGNIRSNLSSFQNAISNLKDVSKFQSSSATLSDSTIASLSTSGLVTAGSYSLEVSKLAQNQKLSSAGLASQTDTIGTGTLTLDFGTITGGAFNGTTGQYTGSTFTANGQGSKTITIGSGNNSLLGIRDAINAANAGVSASIVNDGSGTPYRLAISGKSLGADQSLRISVAGDVGLSNLLAHDPAGTQTLSQSQSAQNAEFKLDGINISKKSNSVSDAISGVTLNLQKTTSSAVTLSVARDTTSVFNSVNSLVQSYNTLNTTLNSLTSYDLKTKVGAVLNGESTVRALKTEIRTVLTGSVGLSNGIDNLSDVGIAFNKDGTLNLSSSKFMTALNTKFDDVIKVFAASGTTSDSLVNYVSATSKTKPGTYAVNVSTLASKGFNAGSAISVSNLTPIELTSSNNTINLTVDGSIAGDLTIGKSNTYGYVKGNDSTFGAGLDLSDASFSVKVDGVSSNAINFDISDNNRDATSLAARLQTLINADANISAAGKSVTVSVDGDAATGKILIRSNSKSSTSAFELTTAVGSNIAQTGLSTGMLTKNGFFDGNDIASELQSLVNGNATLSAASTSIAATFSAGAVNLTSNRYGVSSFVKINSTTATDFGFSAGNGTSGIDAAGTINGVAATGFGQNLSGATGNDAEGINIKIAGGVTGDRGNVKYTQGIAYRLDTLITNINSSGGLLTSRTDGLNNAVDISKTRREELSQRVLKIQARYTKQFNSLDSIVSRMNQTSIYLQQQLAKLALKAGE